MIQQIVAIIVDGLIYSSYLFMVAVGLTVIFGVMKLLNVTHGSFYAFGAYLAATLVGIYYETDLPEFGGFLVLFLSAIAVGYFLVLFSNEGCCDFSIIATSTLSCWQPSPCSWCWKT